MTPTGGSHGKLHRTTKILSHAARRRGSRVAARGARAGEFRRYLTMPDTRLVVVGYSFSDEHINKMILEAAERGSLKMFVVHPRGRGILVKQGAAMIPPPEPLRDDIPSLGESIRPLSSTFLDDELERNLLYRIISP